MKITDIFREMAARLRSQSLKPPVVIELDEATCRAFRAEMPSEIFYWRSENYAQYKSNQMTWGGQLFRGPKNYSWVDSKMTCEYCGHES